MPTNVLLLEDDRNQADFIIEVITGAGYAVQHFIDAEGAWEWVRQGHPFDIVVTDVEMPGLGGPGFCSLLRQRPQTSALPVLMLSVHTSVNVKVEGLEKGADDYLCKPFAKKELLARMSALLRRSKFQGAPRRVLKAEGVELDLDANEVRVCGKVVEFLPKESALLALFLEKRGRVLSHRHIIESVWGFSEGASYDTLKTWISHLRKKLGPLESRLQSVTNQGYRFD